MAKHTWTRVRISLFKPTGYGDEYYVRTKDRGLAIRTVLFAIGHDSHYVNDVFASLCNGPIPEGGFSTPTRKDHILEPISD